MPRNPFSPECAEGSSLLKNRFVLAIAPGSGAKYAVPVVFRPCFRPLLNRRPGRHPLFQQARSFSEIRCSIVYTPVPTGAKTPDSPAPVPIAEAHIPLSEHLVNRARRTPGGA